MGSTRRAIAASHGNAPPRLPAGHGRTPDRLAHVRASCVQRDPKEATDARKGYEILMRSVAKLNAAGLRVGDVRVGDGLNIPGGRS